MLPNFHSILNQTLVNLAYYNSRYVGEVGCAWHAGTLIPAVSNVDNVPPYNFSTASLAADEAESDELYPTDAGSGGRASRGFKTQATLPSHLRSKTTHVQRDSTANAPNRVPFKASKHASTQSDSAEASMPPTHPKFSRDLLLADGLPRFRPPAPDDPRRKLSHVPSRELARRSRSTSIDGDARDIKSISDQILARSARIAAAARRMAPRFPGDNLRKQLAELEALSAQFEQLGRQYSRSNNSARAGAGPRETIQVDDDSFNDPGTCAAYLRPAATPVDPATCDDGVCIPMGLLTADGQLDENIKNRRLNLYASAPVSPQWFDLVDMTFGNGNPTGRAVRSRFKMALPLEGFNTSIIDQAAQTKDIENYVVQDFLSTVISSSSFFEPQISITFEAIKSGALEGLFAEELFLSSPLLIASVITLWLGMAIYLRSSILAVAAMSLFLGGCAPAYLLYRACGYEYIGLFHLLAVVVMMFVGHFLVIIYMNRWDQAERLYAPIPILARSGRLQLRAEGDAAAGDGGDGAGGPNGSGYDYDYDDDDDDFAFNTNSRGRGNRGNADADAAAAGGEGAAGGGDTASRQRLRAQYIAAITADALRPLEASKRYMPSWIWRRLSWTFRSSSFTLALAIGALVLAMLVNIALRLPALRAFSLFAAVLAIVYFILIILVWPAAITCHHKYLYDRRCCICFRPYRKDISLARLQGLDAETGGGGSGGAGGGAASTGPLLGSNNGDGNNSSGGAAGASGAGPSRGAGAAAVAGGGLGGGAGSGEYARLSPFETLFHTRMLLFLVKNRLAVLFLGALIVGVFVYFCTLITIDSRSVTSAIFVDTHPINAFTAARAQFRFGSSIVLDFSFGLNAYRPVDRSTANTLDPWSFGEPVWTDLVSTDNSVDLFAMRNCIMDFCGILGVSNDRLRLLAQSNTTGPTCLIAELSDWMATGSVSQYGLQNVPGGMRNTTLTEDKFWDYFFTFVALEGDCKDQGADIRCYEKYRDMLVFHVPDDEDLILTNTTSNKQKQRRDDNSTGESHSAIGSDDGFIASDSVHRKLRREWLRHRNRALSSNSRFSDNTMYSGGLTPSQVTVSSLLSSLPGYESRTPAWYRPSSQFALEVAATEISNKAINLATANGRDYVFDVKLTANSSVLPGAIIDFSTISTRLFTVQVRLITPISNAVLLNFID